MTAPERAGARSQGIFGGEAWRIGRIRGIDIRIDFTWLFIFLLITFSLGGLFGREQPGWSREVAWGAAVLASLLFFASIVLHELGHSLTALRLGIGVRSITLFIFGGIAQLESEPTRPRDEVVMALAGPLVSVALGLVFHALGQAMAGSPGPMEVLAVVFEWLGSINIVLAIFNVVPGFPLDGGRVLRGLLWARTGSFERATRTAASVGSGFGSLLIALGIVSVLLGGRVVSGLWLAFIGWFLLSAARMSVSQVLLQRVLQQVRAADTMDPVDDSTTYGEETVHEAVTGAVLRRGWRTLYVIDRAQRLRGIATLREISAVPGERRESARVEEIMVPVSELAVLQPRDTGWKALQEMVERGVNQLPVIHEGRLVGRVTRERLLSLVHAQLALEGSAPPGRRADLPI